MNEQKRIQELENKYKNFDLDNNQKKDNSFFALLFIIGIVSAYYLGVFDNSFKNKDNKFVESSESDFSDKKKDFFNYSGVDKNEKEFSEKINNEEFKDEIKKKEDVYSIEINYGNDDGNFKNFDWIKFKKNGKVYKTIKNGNYDEKKEYYFHIEYSKNKEYFAIQKYRVFPELTESIRVDIYNKKGVYMWGGSGKERGVRRLSNNGLYYIQIIDKNTVDVGYCNFNCDHAYVTRKIGKDILLSGISKWPIEATFYNNGKTSLTLYDEKGKNLVNLSETGGLVRGRLYIKRKK